MPHRLRIGVLCIDCQTDRRTEAAGFWSAALGRERRIEPDQSRAGAGF